MALFSPPLENSALLSQSQAACCRNFSKMSFSSVVPLSSSEPEGKQGWATRNMKDAGFYLQAKLCEKPCNKDPEVHPLAPALGWGQSG